MHESSKTSTANLVCCHAGIFTRASLQFRKWETNFCDETATVRFRYEIDQSLVGVSNGCGHPRNVVKTVHARRTHQELD